MTVTADSPAPYAPARAVLDLVGRYRNRGLPSPINGEVLERAGIAPSLIARTLYALEVLDLIDNAGMPTQVFEDLRLAPETEYRDRLADWLRAAYSDVFSFVDLGNDDSARIRDAFRSYRPHGQQDRMVSLFTGLCAAAGLIPERPQAAPRPRAPAAPRPTGGRIVSATDTASRRQRNAPVSIADGSLSSLPPPLAGLLASLPSKGGWTQDRRDRFVDTFGTVLDFCIPIVEDKAEVDKDGDGGT